MEYLCPITKQPMSDPVVAQDGQTYQRDAIEYWLKDHGTSPLTGQALGHKQLTPNLLLRSMIQEWRDASPAA